MKVFAKTAAAVLLLVFATAAAYAGPPPQGPGPVRINGSMPIMNQGGPGGPGGPGPGAGPGGPGFNGPGNPMMGGGPGAQLPPPPPNFSGPGWIGRPIPYNGPNQWHSDNDNSGKVALGILGGLILGGIIGNNS